MIQGDKLTYRINPSQTWNVKNVYGSETGNNNGENSEFIFDGYINLSKLSIDTSTLVDITNSFEQGTKFEKMNPKLESEIKSQLQTKVGDSNKIDIEWNLSDKDSVYYETEINFNISSNWSDIRETYSTSFNSSTFFDLKNLEIDNNEIQKLTMNYNGETFGTVKPVLEEEIMNQMQSKGYRTEFVSIVWFNGDNEIIDFDSIVEYEIVPINSNKVHNTYKGNFHYGIEPVIKNTWLQNLKIYGSIVLSVLFLLMIFLFFIVYKIKQKQKKDRRKILENENSLKENELINQIYEENNLLEDKNDDLFMN